MSPDDDVQVIPVPKPAAKPNKDRPINALVQQQVMHLMDIEQRHIPDHRTGMAVDPRNMTEGQAAEYVKRVTAKLHELGPKPKRTRKRTPKQPGPESETTTS